MKILILIVCIVFSSGHYFISDSFAQGIEKSLGASIGDLAATLGTAFIILIIPVSIAFVIILKMKKKLTRSRIKKFFGGAGLLFIGLLIIGNVSNSFISDEERSARDSARIAEEKAERNLLEKQAYEKEKELAKFQEVYADNGRLKYRPYWLVGDGYKELEFTGYITRDSTCANLADAANAENVIDSFYLGLWLGGCVENPHDDYADILWKGGFLKYRLYWERDDISKNIDNRPAEFKKLHPSETKSTQIQRAGDEAFADAKRELDNYLLALKKGVQECNNIPDSMKISSLVQDEAEEIVVNSVLMYLVIEEIEKTGYSGLSSYKNKIATTVDRLTECLNRH